MKHDPGDPDPVAGLVPGPVLAVRREGQSRLPEEPAQHHAQGRDADHQAVRPPVDLRHQAHEDSCPGRAGNLRGCCTGPFYWGLHGSSSPQRQITLILRHFTISTERSAKFIEDNVLGIDIRTTTPLRTRRPEDLWTTNVHGPRSDLLQLHHRAERESFAQGRGDRAPGKRSDFSAITDDDASIDDLPNTWLNVVPTCRPPSRYTTPLWRCSCRITISGGRAIRYHNWTRSSRSTSARS